MIGVRTRWQINNRWSGLAAADAGGFGAGGNELAWSATLVVAYRTGDNGALKFGIHHYSIDFATVRSDGPFAYKVKQTGPYIGYTYTYTFN